MTKSTETPDFGFVKLEDVATTENPYTNTVKALAEAGEGVGFPITTATADHDKAVRQFQEAAHGIDRSARKHGKSTIDGDNTTSVYKLTERRTRRTAAEIAAETAADSETPVSE